MNLFQIELRQCLDDLREQNLFRELRRMDSAQGPRIAIGGKTLLNFSSNDYLGLANHPALKEAAIRAVEKFGVGAGASRLVAARSRLFTNWKKRSPRSKKPKPR